MTRLLMTPIDCRRAFLRDYLSGLVAFEALLVVHHISRSSGYALVAKERLLGLEAAVVEKSRRPKSSPTKTAEVVINAVVALKKKHPAWGPKKLKALMMPIEGYAVPSVATMASILAARGLTRRSVRKPKAEGRLKHRTIAERPNHVWAMDFKGPMKRYGRIEPFNVVDEYSRKWLCCRPLTDKTGKDVKDALTTLFKQVGLPDIIRIDAGQPWVGVTAPHMLSKLSAWLTTLGIRIEIISCPQENGVLERLHGTMESDMQPCVDVRVYFQQFVDEYNDVRPHEHLEQRPPSSRYRVSERPYKTPPKTTYDMSIVDEIRVVTTSGTVHLNGNEVFMSEALSGQTVGLRLENPTRWRVDFCHLCVGHIDAGRFSKSA